ncbi:WD repeat-containing protein 27 isoform X1 [Oopsacas minuta]|uniref:WD repeat-containing protein 27 isoform X1 n=1 Tax=Oopsacas minuta TaxID=111878 RepID=A0AAV7JCD5_9METZ|nr:WD repeat-containing protein 27 isoform X1 [Oopsacas minuta]
MSVTTSWQGYTSSTLLQPTDTATHNDTLFWCQLSPDNSKVVQCYSLAPPRTYEFEDIESSITALALSYSPSLPLYLASATRTNLTVWTVPVLADSCSNHQVTTDLDCCNGDVVTQLKFNVTSKFLICCSGAKLFVFKFGRILELNAIFEGHSLPITSIFYFSINNNLVVTSSQDRTFRIWDISNNNALFESPLLSSSPLISTQIHPSQDVIMVGSADGSIWLFEWFRDVKKCFLTFELDMKIHFTFAQSSPNKSLNSVKLKTPIINATIQTIQTSKESKEEPTTSHQSWNLTGAYFCSFPFNEPTLPPSYLSSALSRPAYLILTTESRLIIINSNTGAIEYTTNLLEELGNLTAHTKSITHTRFAHSPVSSQDCYFLAVLSPHDITLIVRFRIPELSSEWKLEKLLNFQATSPLLRSSPLSIQLSAKQNSKENVSYSRPSSSSDRSKKQSLDQPIVFHTKIKSSGYGQTHTKAKVFTPQCCKALSSRRPISKSQPCLGRKDYSISDRFPSREKGKIQMLRENGGVRSLSCSSDGEILACGLIDSTIALLSDKSGCKNLLSSGADKSRVMRGHTGKVESLGWSHSGKHLVSASNAECLLWDVRGLRSLLSISTTTNQEINHIQFFYVDKFILLTQGAELCLYAYALENTHKHTDDLKRYLNLNTWKQALRVTQSVHSITACSAANAFYSHISLLGLSNRTLVIHDLNADKQVCNIQLERVVNSIHQYEGSKYCGVQSDAFNMFLTSAVQDSIRVWDVRMNKCIVKYNQHKNSVMPVDCKVSPCGRFIATGSEDKSVYVYDLRGSTRVYVEKIMGFSDVTTRLLFRPSSPELIVSTLDSYLHAFK